MLKIKSKENVKDILTSLDPVPKWVGRVTDVKIGCDQAGSFYIHVAMGSKAIRYLFFSEGYIQCFRDDADGQGMVYVKTIGSSGGYKNPTKSFKKISTCISKLTQKREEACLCL